MATLLIYLLFNGRARHLNEYEGM